MQNRRFTSLPEGLITTALGLLAAAVMIYVAIRLIVAVWVPLAIVSGVAVALGMTFRLWRGRARPW